MVYLFNLYTSLGHLVGVFTLRIIGPFVRNWLSPALHWCNLFLVCLLFFLVRFFLFFHHIDNFQFSNECTPLDV